MEVQLINGEFGTQAKIADVNFSLFKYALYTNLNVSIGFLTLSKQLRKNSG